ncbi:MULTISPECIES: Crp/Fnr family transcriptional regulator [Methylobacterium]|jgi:CRP-like cAMP-binding protein|uniref:Crp/Fnr family transcriptional regulator n=2 Tax=Methylobacterium longum TaxID=767694 RepID=A0ABT8ALM8_9HYPH|nr:MULTISPECIES: Crp/Fnr family transcriptional regulator [Methylobacterium]MCJ2102857.1 Crp/Fnr family transcriptional regulator [Methylobacterium sp. E-046]MDN3570193.1 Crp/Fnr family transcriptional regulator [Methylobacterium longum]
MQDNDTAGAEDGTSRPDGRAANPLILKLESLAPLSADDRAVLERISAKPHLVPAGTDLIGEGDKPDGVYLVLDGIACRYKLRASGARQIMAYLVPGDYCDLDVAMLKAMDHSIGTLSACHVVRISLDVIQALLRDHPGITHALRLATLVDEATLREWLVNVGRRSAEERIAHLMCELLLRLRAVGRTAGDGYALPITQEDLADTTGLTSVHVNRTLGSLKQRGLIALSGRQLRILDLAGLETLAEFKPNYLHLGGRDAA